MKLQLLTWMLALQNSCHVAASSATTVPWQSSTVNVLEEQTYRGLPPIVFAPGGRLYSVERTMAAASALEDSSSNLVVAISCKHGLVIVSTSPISPHLDTTTSPTSTTPTSSSDEKFEIPLWSEDPTDESFRPPLSCVAQNVWMITGGNAVDSSILRHKIHLVAESLREAYDAGQPLPSSSIPCAIIARRVADYLQLPTQTIGKAGRMLACSVLIVGENEVQSSESTCCMWRLDTTGQFWKCAATAIGRGAALAESHLLDLIAAQHKQESTESMERLHIQNYLSTLSINDAITLACQCIQKALPEVEHLRLQGISLQKPSDGQSIVAHVLHNLSFL